TGTAPSTTSTTPRKDSPGPRRDEGHGRTSVAVPFVLRPPERPFRTRRSITRGPRDRSTSPPWRPTGARPAAPSPRPTRHTAPRRTTERTTTTMTIPRALSLPAVMTALALTHPACGNVDDDDAPDVDEEALNLGILYPQTGSLARLGSAQLTAAEYA